MKTYYFSFFSAISSNWSINNNIDGYNKFSMKLKLVNTTGNNDNVYIYIYNIHIYVYIFLPSQLYASFQIPLVRQCVPFPLLSPIIFAFSSFTLNFSFVISTWMLDWWLFLEPFVSNQHEKSYNISKNAMFEHGMSYISFIAINLIGNQCVSNIATIFFMEA